jgi:hypothetical protein
VLSERGGAHRESKPLRPPLPARAPASFAWRRARATGAGRNIDCFLARQMDRRTNGRRSLTFAAGVALALGGLRADAQVVSNLDPGAIISATAGGAASAIPSDVGAGTNGVVTTTVTGATVNSASPTINANLSSPSTVPGFNGTATGSVLGTNASLNSPSTVPGFSGTLVGGPLGTNSNLSSPSTVAPFSGTAGGSPTFVDELPLQGLTP